MDCYLNESLCFDFQEGLKFTLTLVIAVVIVFYYQFKVADNNAF